MMWLIAGVISLVMLELAARLLRGQDTIAVLICALLHIRASIVCAGHAAQTAAMYCVVHYRRHYENSRHHVLTDKRQWIARAKDEYGGTL